MAQSQHEQDTILKALAFDAIQNFENVQSPSKILSSLKNIPFFKHVPYAAVILFEEALNSHQQFAVVEAMSPEPTDLSSPAYRYSSQDMLWLWEASTHIPFMVNDIVSDPRMLNITHPFDDDMLHALLAVALLINDQPIGWLIVAHYKANAFTPTDARFLQFIAPSLAIKVSVQKQLQSTEINLNRNEQVLAANQKFLMDTSNLNDVYEHVVKAFISENGDICLLVMPLGEREDTLVEIVAADKKDVVSPELKQLIGQTYNLDDYPELSTIGKQGSVFSVEEVAEYRAFNTEEKALLTQLSAQAIIVLPLMSAEKQTNGYILLGFANPTTMNNARISFYKMLAQQAGFAINYARQLRNVQQRAMQLQTGAEISKITNVLQDEDALITQAIEQIKTGFNLYYVGLFLSDEANEWAVLKEGSGEAGAAQVAAGHKLAIQAEGSMIGWAISQQKARIALDVGQDAVHFNNPLLPETRSEMALPLTSHGEALGALTIQSTEKAAFSEDDIITLQIMADELANAIRNARLYQTAVRANQETNSLLEINRDISTSTNLPELFKTIIGHAVHLVLADQGTIFLIDKDVLVPQAVEGDFQSEMLAVRPKVGEGVSGTAASTHKTVSKTFVTDEMGVQIPGTPLLPESIIGVPIKTETQTIGVLLVRRINDVRGFSKADTNLLEGLALQAAIAWQNLTLLNSLEKNLHREQVIRQVVARIHASSGVENILQSTVTELSKALNTHGGAIQLSQNGETNDTRKKQVYGFNRSK